MLPFRFLFRSYFARLIYIISPVVVVVVANCDSTRVSQEDLILIIVLYRSGLLILLAAAARGHPLALNIRGSFRFAIFL